ncbi:MULTISPECIES: hypothetical protein [unclassified Streptomyces]|uniref:hypothetical protein n=1 Tax=unclassified Streptomyces TaxID=2593676 RepID=UPI0037030482
MTVTLNDLIAVRLAEIAEAAWDSHRITPVGDGRVLGLGSAATRERWVCGADHGHGVCNEPLLTHRQAGELLGLLNEDEPVLDPQLPVTDVELLDEQVGGFVCGSLYHFSDVGLAYRSAQEEGR